MPPPEPNEETNHFSFKLRLGDEELAVSGGLPPRGSPVTAMLPLFLGIGEALLAASGRESGKQGLVPSCGPGCGACCRQLVPISCSEAAFLRDEVIPNLDKDHRQRVGQRIAAAKERLETSGLEAELEALPEESDPEKRQAVGLRYFRMGIPCPFLEDESCSIHPQRPLACREYLVTSPAACCARPDEGGVIPLALRVKPSHALIRADKAATREPGWTPMITSLTATTFPAARLVEDPQLELEGFLRFLYQG